MSDESPDNQADTSGGVVNSRRQLLSLVGAGVVGGVLGAGLGTRMGEDDIGTVELPEINDSREYDVFLAERDGTYRATDPDGETLHSGGDGWSMLQRSLDTVPDNGALFVTGEYAGSSPLRSEKSLRMHGQDAVIDHRGAGDFALSFEGTERYQTELAAEAAAGADTVELDSISEIRSGDMVLLEDAGGPGVLGRGKPAGEPHSVLGRNGSTVRLEDSILWPDGYDAGTLVYVINPISVHVSGFNLKAPDKNGDYFGVRAQNCRDSLLENLWLDGFGNRGILLDACANSRVRDCTVLRSSDIENGNGYGIQVWAGSHDILVEGCTAKECRHPVSVTAGGPREVASRSVTVRDCFVAAEGSAALNCHGGSAHDVRFEGCEVHTSGDPGVRTGARATNVTGCEFRMDGHNAIDTRDDGQEMQLTVTDTDIFGAGSAVHLDGESEFEFNPLWNLVQLDGVRANGCGRFFDLDGEDIDRVRELNIRGSYWDEVNEEGLRISNRIDGGVVQGNDFGDALSEPHIIVRDTPTAAVSNLQITDNRFRQPNGSEAFIRLTRSEQCDISGNTFESEAAVPMYSGGVGSTANSVTGNAYYAPSPAADPVDVNDGSVARNNAVYDTERGEWL